MSKAYQVTDRTEGNAVIVFAETPGQAKARGHGELWVEFLDVDARRLKWADEYIDKGFVPKQAMLEHGWQWECHKCFKFVDVENGTVFDEKVYCNKCVSKLDGDSQ